MNYRSEPLITKKICVLCVSMLRWGLLAVLLILIAWDYNHLPKNFPTQEKLLVEIDGPQNSKTTYVFLHGWPDSNALWQPTAKLLSAENRCIRIQLPGYHPEEGIWPGGFDGAEKLIFKTILENVDPLEGITLIGHDWGALLVHYLLLHEPVNKQEENLKKSFRSAVVVDVGLSTHQSLSFKVWVIFYQGLNNIFYCLPTLGNFMVPRLVSLMGRPSYSGELPITAKMNWPYPAMWSDLIFRSGENLYQKAIVNFAAGNSPKIPMLFVWGSAKPSFAQMFDQQYLDSIKATHKLSTSFPVNGGHWLMITHAEEFHKKLTDWLAETNEK